MKKTVRFHRGDSPFKMMSPLKEADGPDDNNSESSSSSSENIARSGDTKVILRRKVKKREATSNVEVQGPKQRPMMGNEAYKKYLATETTAQKIKRLAREAKEKAEDDAARQRVKDAKNSNKKAGEDIEEEAVPVKTPKVEGTTSDTFTSEERRIQNRGEKVTMRQERQLGRQTLRRNKRFMKGSAEFKSMTPEERRAAINELKYGKSSSDKTPSQLDRFGEDFKSRTEQARKMKGGQGEMNNALVDQEVKNPGDARATRMEQYTQGKGWVNSTETQNKADILKADAGGKDVKVTEEEKKTLEDVPLGKRTYSKDSSSSTKTKAEETPKDGNKPNSEAAKEKAKTYFQNALNKFDANKLISGKAEPAATQNNKEQSDALEKHRERKPLTPVDSSLEGQPSSVAKMASKGFSMKGFGSKSGFNFNNKK